MSVGVFLYTVTQYNDYYTILFWLNHSILHNALTDYSHQMVGLSQREAWEPGFLNWILVAVLLYLELLKMI